MRSRLLCRLEVVLHHVVADSSCCVLEKNRVFLVPLTRVVVCEADRVVEIERNLVCRFARNRKQINKEVVVDCVHIFLSVDIAPQQVCLLADLFVHIRQTFRVVPLVLNIQYQGWQLKALGLFQKFAFLFL